MPPSYKKPLSLIDGGQSLRNTQYQSCINELQQRHKAFNLYTPMKGPYC